MSETSLQVMSPDELQDMTLDELQDMTLDELQDMSPDELRARIEKAERIKETAEKALQAKVEKDELILKLRKIQEDIVRINAQLGAESQDDDVKEPEVPVKEPKETKKSKKDKAEEPKVELPEWNTYVSTLSSAIMDLLSYPKNTPYESGREIAIQTANRPFKEKLDIIGACMKMITYDDTGKPIIESVNLFQDGYYDHCKEVSMKSKKSNIVNEPIALIGTHTSLFLPENIDMMIAIFQDNEFTILCIGEYMLNETKVMRIIGRPKRYRGDLRSVVSIINAAVLKMSNDAIKKTRELNLHYVGSMGNA